MNNNNSNLHHSLKGKVNAGNEKIKIKYFEFLKESQGFSESTLNAVKKAIYRYEEFSGFEDYKKFNKKRAIEFKKWLEDKKDPRTNKQISLTTVYHYIRNLKDFFKWLAYQPGYKSKISLTDVEYLKLDKQKARIATASKREDFPTLEQILKIIQTIKINSELDLRDRALISFTTLSGMRDSAIITLPVGCFDENKLRISQDPKKGVKTKFSKTIYSYLFRFDDDMLNYFLDWYRYLKTEKLFGNADPIFPRNKVINAEGTKTFTSHEVEPAFWQSVTSMREIFKARFKAADIDYLPPHTFRHLAVSLATAKCKNAEELKAISQNFGHEDIGTTFQTYGTLSNSKIGELVTAMDFTNTDSDSELMAKLKSLIDNQKGGKF
jgi:integrase